ncbi:MAG: hypothetical protein AAFR93_08815 [Pseudomonadota bacterium]
MTFAWDTKTAPSPGFGLAYHDWWRESGAWQRLGLSDAGAPPVPKVHPLEGGGSRWSGFDEPKKAPVPPHVRNTSNTLLSAPVVPKEVLARLTPETVILGVIDGAMALNNARFRTQGGTSRILWAWTMGATWIPGQTSVPYGREVWAGEIERTQTEHTYGGWLDEAACDQALGLVDMHMWDGPRSLALSASHGTHVLDLAGGAPPDAPMDVMIMAVSLPEQITRDTSGTFLQAFALDGIHAILDRADALWQACGFEGETPGFPVALNFSYGISAGPKDGTLELESEIDRLIQARQADALAPVRMVMPAGNNNLDQTQAQITLKQGESEDLTWRLPPQDFSTSYLEVWMPRFLDSDALATKVPQLELTLPDGTVLGAPSLNVGQSVDLLPVGGGAPAGRLYCDRQNHATSKSGRVRLLLALSPTASRSPGAATVSPGAWGLRLQVDTDMHVILDLSIQRDDTIGVGPDRGVPSFFEDDAYRVHDARGDLLDTDGELVAPASNLRRRGTMNAIATGVTTCRVGAYEVQSERSAPYSASGFGEMHLSPLLPQVVERPNVAAAGDTSRAKPGVMAAGTRSGSVVFQSGTSMACAQTARLVADLLKPWHKTRDPLSNLGVPGAVEHVAISAESRGVYATPAPIVEKAGAGRLPYKPLQGYRQRSGDPG